MTTTATATTTKQSTRRRRRPQPTRSLVVMAALAALVFAALAAKVVRADAGFDPAELVVPGGSPTSQEKLDAVQSRLGQVQGDLEQKTGG